jgi:1-acyl-sn-glycerol-3-phosphate acyltransferase
MLVQATDTSTADSPKTLNQEYAIIGKGIFRMAAKHNVPIIPIYCFGSSMLLRRLRLPEWIEKLGLLLRMSLVVMFGQYGLPIPFRQRLMYVIGNPIYPDAMRDSDSSTNEQVVADMYKRYCKELIRIFDRHKESYAAGWASKQLTILSADT